MEVAKENALHDFRLLKIFVRICLGLLSPLLTRVIEMANANWEFGETDSSSSRV